MLEIKRIRNHGENSAHDDSLKVSVDACAHTLAWAVGSLLVYQTYELGRRRREERKKK